MCIKGVDTGHDEDGVEVEGSTGTTLSGAAREMMPSVVTVEWGGVRGDHDAYPITTCKLACHHPDDTKRTTCTLLYSKQVTRKECTLAQLGHNLFWIAPCEGRPAHSLTTTRPELEQVHYRKDVANDEAKGDAGAERSWKWACEWQRCVHTYE